MKIRALVITLAIVGLASSALASDKTKEKQEAKARKARQQQVGEGRQTVVLTGSYLKQEVRRNGRITDGPNQVVVLDRDAIERSGAPDLKRVFSRTGTR